MLFRHDLNNAIISLFFQIARNVHNALDEGVNLRAKVKHCSSLNRGDCICWGRSSVYPTMNSRCLTGDMKSITDNEILLRISNKPGDEKQGFVNLDLAA